MQSIKKRGGIVIAEDEATSACFSMPRSAIATGCVDYVLPLQEDSKHIVLCTSWDYIYSMNEDEKWRFIGKLDEELLLGGVILSEWSTFLIRDADIAFVHGAHLSAILTALAGIESHLRYEHGSTPPQRLVDLIDAAMIPDALRTELHLLRRYRNKWVHVSDPHDDNDLLSSPDAYGAELKQVASRAIRALRETIYTDQWL